MVLAHGPWKFNPETKLFVRMIVTEKGSQVEQKGNGLWIISSAVDLTLPPRICENRPVAVAVS